MKNLKNRPITNDEELNKHLIAGKSLFDLIPVTGDNYLYKEFDGEKYDYLFQVLDNKLSPDGFRIILNDYYNQSMDYNVAVSHINNYINQTTGYLNLVDYDDKIGYGYIETAYHFLKTLVKNKTWLTDIARYVTNNPELFGHRANIELTKSLVEAINDIYILDYLSLYPHDNIQKLTKNKVKQLKLKREEHFEKYQKPIPDK